MTGQAITFEVNVQGGPCLTFSLDHGGREYQTFRFTVQQGRYRLVNAVMKTTGLWVDAPPGKPRSDRKFAWLVLERVDRLGNPFGVSPSTFAKAIDDALRQYGLVNGTLADKVHEVRFLRDGEDPDLVN